MPLRPAGFEWEVPGAVVHVLAGNLIVVDLDLGWYVTIRTRVRVRGLVIADNQRSQLAARKYAQKLLPHGSSVIIRSSEISGLSRSCTAEVRYGPSMIPQSDEGGFVHAMVAAGVAIREPGEASEDAQRHAAAT